MAARERRTRLIDQPPRLMSEAETAHHLHMSVSQFCRRMEELERSGMPRRHPVLRKRDRVAIDRWLDAEFGVDRKPDNLAALVRRRMEGPGDGHGAD